MATTYAVCEAPAWAISTAYVVGDRVENDTSKIYECITAGTSAASGGPTGTGTDITDGTVHWKYLVTRDYSTFSSAESATDDPVGDTTSYILELWGAGLNGGDWTSTWTIQPATGGTSATYFRTFEASSNDQHTGTLVTGGLGVCIAPSSASTALVLRQEDYGIFNYLTVDQAYNAKGFATNYWDDPIGVEFNYCIARGPADANDNTGFSVHTQAQNASVTCNVCLAYDWGGDGFGRSDGTLKTYHCTAVDCNTSNNNYRGGFNIRNGSGSIAKNCAGFGTLKKDFYLQTGPTITYCCSSDATADDAGGAGNLINKVATSNFTNYSADDFTVKDTSADIYHAGSPVSGITTDLAGNTFDATNPSIGCYEYVAAGGTTVLLSSAVQSKAGSDAAAALALALSSLLGASSGDMATLALGHALASGLRSRATKDDALGLGHALTSKLAGRSAAEESLSLARAIAASVGGRTGTDALPSLIRVLSSDLAALTGATGQLASLTVSLLAAEVHARSGLAGAPQASRGLAGDIGGAAALDAVLANARGLRAALKGLAGTQGSLGPVARLKAALGALAGSRSTLGRVAGLKADVQAIARLDALLTRAAGLAADLEGRNGALARLNAVLALEAEMGGRAAIVALLGEILVPDLDAEPLPGISFRALLHAAAHRRPLAPSVHRPSMEEEQIS